MLEVVAELFCDENVIFDDNDVELRRMSLDGELFESQLARSVWVASQYLCDIITFILSEREERLCLAMLGSSRIDDPRRAIFESDTDDVVNVLKSGYSLVM